jgi:hypothetical protein
MVKDRDLFGLKGLAALSSLRSVEEFLVSGFKFQVFGFSCAELAALG